MVNTYVLVNPYIKGSLNTSVKANNSTEAASMLYTSISDHFSSTLPTFYFTLRKGQTGGKFYHFKVNEQKQNSQNSDEISFNISELQLSDGNYINDNFIKKLDYIKSKIDSQEGGKVQKKNSKTKNTGRKKTKETSKNKKNDDDDGSSSESHKKKSKKDSSSSSESYKKHKKHKKKKHSRKHSSSSSSSISSLDNIYIKTRHNYYKDPIYYFWYDPLVYKVNDIFIPTFYSYTKPLLQVDTSIISILPSLL